MFRKAKTDTMIEYAVYALSIGALQDYVRDYLRQFYESKDSDEFNEIYNEFSKFRSENEGGV